MQTLGLSDSTPGTENRLKALLWPSVNTASDVDYLGTQGYWVCTIVAVATFLFALLVGQEGIGLLYLLFYYLGGVGVRERSRYAAVVVATMYTIDTLVLLTVGAFGAGIVVRIIFSALLLANVRATWIAANWNPSSEEAVAPPRLNQTWGDKFADQFPRWLWPRAQIVYYIYSVAFMVMVGVILTRAR